MMKKNEIKILNRFIKETHINKEDFAEEAGVTIAILNRAMKSGKISEKYANDIFKAIVRESLQYKLITGKDPRVVKEIRWAVVILISVFVMLFLALISLFI